MSGSATRQIGRWNVVRRIPRTAGRQGEVYEVSSGEGGEIFALKLVKATSAKKIGRFREELRQHKALSDQRAPNIMPILDCSPDTSTECYFVMPLAVGTLEEFVGLFEGRLELSLEVFIGIVRGVEQAHSIGVIHRDIKPANVLFLDRSLSEPYVSDFGICLLKAGLKHDRLTDVGETVGARWFMAPEQERGGVVDVTEAADVYALGKLLSYIVTGRHLFREDVDTVFTSDEIARDPRLALVRDTIVRKTVIEDKEARIQSAWELRVLAEQVLHSFRDSPGTASTPNTSTPRLADQNLASPSEGDLGLQQAYQQAVLGLAEGRSRLIRLQFDVACRRFIFDWVTVRLDIGADPKMAQSAAQNMILRQAEGIAAVLAMVRFDASELLQDFKHYVEYFLSVTEDEAGDRRVRSVPHVCAGFSYMLAAVAAVQRQAWDTLNFLLSVKFEWYYQSKRPLYGYAFDLPYFFHPEALERKATSAHDFYRAVMTRAHIAEILNLRESEITSAYAQAQFLMCVKAAQLGEQGENLSMFADFGRFYPERIEPLLQRIVSDDSFASGALRTFGESRTEWLEKLPQRLTAIRRNFWDSRLDWASISRWPE